MLGKKEISAYTLKWIAILCMLIDHVTAAGIFVQNMLQYQIGRGIGRIAFPIFCFLIVEGYFHTKNRTKYLGRLLLLAFLSEVPFDMVFSGNYLQTGYQNVFFTLSLGLIGMILLGEIDKKMLKRLKASTGMAQKGFRAGNALLQLIVVAGMGVIASLIRCDYGTNGVLLILMIYFLEKFYIMFPDSIRKYGEQKVKNMLAGFAIFLWFLMYDLNGGGVNEIYGFPAILLVYLYGGKRGKYSIPAWFFYAFYPLHLMVVVLLRKLYYGI